jgi:hypothetical protein
MDEPTLIALYERLKKETPFISAFYEPDVQDQMTAICVYGTPEIRKKVSSIPLALKNYPNTIKQ